MLQYPNFLHPSFANDTIGNTCYIKSWGRDFCPLQEMKFKVYQIGLES